MTANLQGDASGETQQIKEEEPIYPDMPSDLTYMKTLTWKSRKCDQLWFELRDLQKHYAKRIAPDTPYELLAGPENLKIYNWIKSLSNNEQGILLIDYAYKHEKIDEDFMDDMEHRDSPFYLPIVEKWAQSYWERKKTKLELEIENEEKALRDLRQEIQTLTKQKETDLKAYSKELESAKKNLEAEKSKLDGIDKKTKAFDRITDWLRSFYAGRLEIQPTQKELINSIFKVESELHVLGLYGICNNCQDKLVEKGRWNT